MKGQHRSENSKENAWTRAEISKRERQNVVKNRKLFLQRILFKIKKTDATSTLLSYSHD